MKATSRPLPIWLKWLCRIFGAILILGSLYLIVLVVIALVETFHVFLGPQGHSVPDSQWPSIFGGLVGKLVGQTLLLLLGIWLWRRAGEKVASGDEASSIQTLQPPIAAPVATAFFIQSKNKRWSFCNILQIAPEAKKLWQFNAKGSGFVLGGEQRVPHSMPLPSKFVAKTWSSLWQPKLNVAWLPPENVFLRAIELPASNAEETFAMVELQLEKISPLPVTQIVWTFQALPHAGAENLQTIIVVIVARNLVEEFLGKLERDGFLADRLEVPMLDQLDVLSTTEDGAWIFPQIIGNQNAALIAWRSGGALRNLSFVALPPAGDRAVELKNQIAHILWSGELEGWLTAAPKWHLIADPVNAAEWENLLRTGLNEPVQIIAPPSTIELAARTAKRAAAGTKTNLLPPEFSERYRQQFHDRLWLHGLGYAGLLYAIALVIYFCAVGVLTYKTGNVEAQVSGLANTYTNALQLTAEYKVLSERQQLKYAALDCWKIVADQLPQTVTLQSFNFGDGEKLSLSGTAPADQVDTLFNFNDAMKKIQLNGQPMFDQNKGETVSPKLIGGTEQWRFTVELAHPEAQPQ